MNILEDDNLPFLIILSVLSRKKIKIRIKKNEEFYFSFISLIKKITHNTSFSLEEDILSFDPGFLVGGKVTHECVKNVCCYILPILVAAPFCKIPLQMTLKGITNDHEMSVDSVRLVYLKTLSFFKVEDAEMKIIKRGFFPCGEGEVYMHVGIVDKLSSIDLCTEEEQSTPEKKGCVKQPSLSKIRGIAVTSRLNSSTAHGLIESSKEILSCIPNLRKNMKIFVDISNKNDSGPSPGYQLILFAEGNMTVYFSEQIGDPSSNIKEVSSKAVKELLRSIKKGGFYDYKTLPLILCLMALTPSEVSRIHIYKLRKEDKEILEFLKIFFGYSCTLKKVKEGYVLSSLGVGFVNYNKVLQ